MNILKHLPTHKVLEVNLSVGLRISHMLAQMPFAKPATGVAKDFIDNGLLFEMDSKTGAVALADNTATGQLFIHYTEELMNSIVSGFKYFTVEYDANGVAYPRLIALYSGDTYTTDNFVITTKTTDGAVAPANTSEYNYAIPKAGQFEIFKTLPTTHTGHVFKAKATTLPDGTAAVEVMFVK